MARAVARWKESAAQGDSLVDTYTVFFFGTDMPAADSSVITVTTGPTDTLAQAETKVVDAVMAEAVRLDYAVLRTRVVYPKLARGT